MKKIECISNVYEKKETYSFFINKQHVEIIFIDGDFKRVNFQFIGPYSREQWKILSKVERLISDIEKGKINV